MIGKEVDTLERGFLINQDGGDLAVLNGGLLLSYGSYGNYYLVAYFAKNSSIDSGASCVLVVSDCAS